MQEEEFVLIRKKTSEKKRNGLGFKGRGRRAAARSRENRLRAALIESDLVREMLTRERGRSLRLAPCRIDGRVFETRR